MKHEDKGGVRTATKVLMASHAHPKLSNGGAEISAYELYRALDARSDYESWFLGCAPGRSEGRLGAPIYQPFSDRDFVYASSNFDWFKFANRDPNFPQEFDRILETIQPDIVHFHHYAHLGVEALMHVKRRFPDCKIVLTLHEYLAICHHFGQMVRTERQTLCYEASPRNCNDCFRNIAPSDFFLREQYIKRFFGFVDCFVSPSHFLAQRYVDWGLAPDRIRVIENVIPAAPVAVDVEAEDDGVLRVGFFGQISLLKGVNVLFDAASLLADAARLHDERGDVSVLFDIYGDYRGQPAEFQADFTERLDKAGKNVRYHGPYRHDRVDHLMRSVDIVLVPSIWWENSPLVIQEALRNGRTVVCSDIGGMAEKVVPLRDGHHFAVGDSVSLARLLRRLAADPARLRRSHETIKAPSPETVVAEHEALYRDLLD